MEIYIDIYRITVMKAHSEWQIFKVLERLSDYADRGRKRIYVRNKK